MNSDTLEFHKQFIRRAFDEEVDRARDTVDHLGAVLARQTAKSAADDPLDDVGDDLNLTVVLTLASIRKPNREIDKIRQTYATKQGDSYGMYLGAYRTKYGLAWNPDGRYDNGEMIRLMKGGIANERWPKDDIPRVVGAFRWYFRAEGGGSPGLATLWEPILRKWF